MHLIREAIAHINMGVDSINLFLSLAVASITDVLDLVRGVAKGVTAIIITTITVTVGEGVEKGKAEESIAIVLTTAKVEKLVRSVSKLDSIATGPDTHVSYI